MRTCPDLIRPRWCPSPLAMTRKRTAAFRSLQGVGFLSLRAGRLSSSTTIIHISGFNSTACTLATPGFVHPVTGMHAGSLRTCQLDFGPVGFALLLLHVAHRLGNNNEFQNLLSSFIPSLRIYLGASMHSLSLAPTDGSAHHDPCGRAGTYRPNPKCLFNLNAQYHDTLP